MSDTPEEDVRMSPTQRFEHGLRQTIMAPVLRSQVRRLWESEFKVCVVYWDAEVREIAFVGDAYEVSIRERRP